MQNCLYLHIFWILFKKYSQFYFFHMCKDYIYINMKLIAIHFLIKYFNSTFFIIFCYIKFDISIPQNLCKGNTKLYHNRNREHGDKKFK